MASPCAASRSADPADGTRSVEPGPPQPSYGTDHRASLWRQAQPGTSQVLLWARVVTAVTSVAEGYAMGVINGVAVLVKKDMALSSFQTATFVGSAMLAVAFGSPIGSVIGDAIGRRPSLALSYVALATGCLIMSLSPSFTFLIIGRIVEAIGIGSGLGIVTTYMSELAPMLTRGVIGSCEEVFIIIGIVLGYASNRVLLDWPYNWRVMFGLGAVLPMFGLCLLALGVIPESPRFLLLHGRVHPTRRTVLDALYDPAESAAMLQSFVGSTDPTASWSEVLCPARRSKRKMVLASVGVTLCQALSGIAILTAASDAMLHEELSDKDAFGAILGLGFCRLCFVMIALNLVDRIGRRSLLLISSGGVTVSLFALAGCYMKGYSAMPWKIGSMVLLFAFYELGLGPLTYVYSSEVLDAQMRSKGVGLSFFVSRIYMSLSVTAFMLVGKPGPMLLAMVGLNAFGFIFMMCCVPETKGRTLENMHEIFGSETEPDGAQKAVANNVDGDSLCEGKCGVDQNASA